MPPPLIIPLVQIADMDSAVIKVMAEATAMIIEPQTKKESNKSSTSKASKIFSF